MSRAQKHRKQKMSLIGSKVNNCASVQRSVPSCTREHRVSLPPEAGHLFPPQHRRTFCSVRYCKTTRRKCGSFCQEQKAPCLCCSQKQTESTPHSIHVVEASRTFRAYFSEDCFSSLSYGFFSDSCPCRSLGSRSGAVAPACEQVRSCILYQDNEPETPSPLYRLSERAPCLTPCPKTTSGDQGLHLSSC